MFSFADSINYEKIKNNKNLSVLSWSNTFITVKFINIRNNFIANSAANKFT